MMLSCSASGKSSMASWQAPWFCADSPALRGQTQNTGSPSASLRGAHRPQGAQWGEVCHGVDPLIPLSYTLALCVIVARGTAE